MNKTTNQYINQLNLDPKREAAVRKLVKGAGGVSDSTPLVESLVGNELIPIKQDSENKAVSVEQIKNNILALPSKYEFVDLGLPSGTKWATCNIGANNPEEYGLYFAWGETQGYEGITDEKQFNWIDYKLCGGSYSTLTKYNHDSSNGTVDNLTTLELEDDAAYQSDNTCRIPTKDELQELVDNTTSTWETLNGVNGRRFTSTNGNSIFVPAAGICDYGSINNVGSYGYLWSSSLNEIYSRGAWNLGFDSRGMGVGSHGRFGGFSVRPVQPANTPTTINLKELQDKVDNIQTDGDGTKFLSDDGSYKEVGQAPYIWDGTTSETIFNELKEAIESNRRIVFGNITIEAVIFYSYIYIYAEYIDRFGKHIFQYKVNSTTVTSYNYLDALASSGIITVYSNTYNILAGTNPGEPIDSNYAVQLNSSDDMAEEYQGEFSFGDTVYTVTFPDTVKWSTDSVLEYKANHTYQFKIVNNLGVMKEFANS